MRNRSILILSLVTILIFPLVGFVLHNFFLEGDFWNIFETKASYELELLLGLLAGVIGGLGAWNLVNLSFMVSMRHKYQDLIYRMKLNLITIILVSICAGVGEETLFRGILQQFFGIWLTAIIFVAIHGYLSPFDWKISLYGAYMVLLIALLGWMKEQYGLTSAMLAHTIIDIILFYQLTHKPLTQHSNSTLDTAN